MKILSKKKELLDRKVGGKKQNRLMLKCACVCMCECVSGYPAVGLVSQQKGYPCIQFMQCIQFVRIKEDQAVIQDHAIVLDPPPFHVGRNSMLLIGYTHYLVARWMVCLVGGQQQDRR